MASSKTITDAFSGRPAYQLRLLVRHSAYSGNTQALRWDLYAERIDTGTTYALDPQSYTVTVNGQNFSGSHSMDLRSPTTSITMGLGTTSYIAHDSNGYLTVSISASINASGTLFGTASASGTFVTDRIAQVPDAPSSTSLSQITANSIVYKYVQGADNGGASVTAFQVQYATNSGFTTGVGTVTAGTTGTTTISGLTPGTKYWFRVRAQNSVGWSSYSSSLNASTLSGAFVGNTSSATYSAAGVYVGSGGVFVLTEVLVGSGGSFVTAS